MGTASPTFERVTSAQNCEKLSRKKTVLTAATWIREGATLVQTAADVAEMLRPIDPRALRAPGSGYVPQPATPADADDRDRSRITTLLGPVPVAVDELVRQSGRPTAIVQTVLLELELAGRLERHAGGRVSLT